MPSRATAAWRISNARNIANARPSGQASEHYRMECKYEEKAMKKQAVFLDRDGVINRYAYNAEFGTFDTPATPEQFELLAGAGEAIAALNALDVPVIVVSNQPGIAKGKF